MAGAGSGTESRIYGVEHLPDDYGKLYYTCYELY